MTAGFTSAALGVIIAVGILWLVRRDRMHGGYAMWWLLVAVVALGIGLFPRVVDWLGVRFGVSYPPLLLVLGALVVIVLKLAATDIDATIRERRLRRLLQKVAILELELKAMRAELDRRDAAISDTAPSGPASPAADVPPPAAVRRRAAV